MGLIRKTLAVGTVGMVRPSSKKQRVAKATMKNTKANARAAAQMAADTASANHLAATRDAEEREFRYATDAKYRKFVDDKRAAEAAQIRAEQDYADEQARLRRARNQARLDKAVQVTVRTVALTASLVAIPLVAILVWAPQTIIARRHNRPSARWLAGPLFALLKGRGRTSA